MSKQELINALIQDDLTNITSGDMNWWIEQILRVGFSGYNNQSLKQLRQEYKERELENQLANSN